MARLFVISDIHGHIEGAKRLLKLAGYAPESDRLILLGDYINMDSDVKKTLGTIRRLHTGGAIALAGNMERAYLLWHICTGTKPVIGVTARKFLESLPLYHKRGTYLFVHAGVRPGIPLKGQREEDLVSIRQDFWGSRSAHTFNVVFGHTPTQHMGAEPGELWHGPRMLGIDTGAKHGHRLTLVELTGKEAYSCSTDRESLYGDVRMTNWGERSLLK
ncbi:metallophosphoesterase [Cohnella yongneupensis]|uniref:Metallophosphoesterase n=1 Tax=Cohnella yongneupensis TaxID=425006 RepID=A0ABW0R7A7_9BACL